MRSNVPVIASENGLGQCVWLGHRCAGCWNAKLPISWFPVQVHFGNAPCQNPFNMANPGVPGTTKIKFAKKDWLKLDSVARHIWPNYFDLNTTWKEFDHHHVTVLDGTKNERRCEPNIITVVPGYARFKIFSQINGKCLQIYMAALELFPESRCNMVSARVKVAVFHDGVYKDNSTSSCREYFTPAHEDVALTPGGPRFVASFPLPFFDGLFPLSIVVAIKVLNSGSTELEIQRAILSKLTKEDFAAQATERRAEALELEVARSRYILRRVERQKKKLEKELLAIKSGGGEPAAKRGKRTAAAEAAAAAASDTDSEEEQEKMARDCESALALLERATEAACASNVADDQLRRYHAALSSASERLRSTAAALAMRAMDAGVKTCSVCLDRGIDTRLPCRHMMCRECARRPEMTACPLCKKPFENHELVMCVV